ncbi:MAG: HD-GYP domain-containing protein, partial [Gaiellaceae bacterium]
MSDGAKRHRWAAHPLRARGVRVLVYALPIAASLGFVFLATSIVRAPTSSLGVFLLWWLATSLAATLVVSAVYAVSRRLLPLGALLELSLVFPDAAPSRFQIALRTGTVETLEQRLELMRQAREASSAQEAAEILLRLVGALSVHDSITRGHAERVRAYSSMLGRQLGLGDDDLDRLNWAALLHDIGKLEVSQEILNRTGKPTD